MMMKRLVRRASLVQAAVWILWNASLASAAGGTYAGNVLLKAPSARAASMGEAYSSLGSDVGGIPSYQYNPAATAFLKGPEFSFTGQRGVADDNYGSLFLGTRSELGSFAGHLLYYSVGNIELIDTLGQSRTVNAEQDLGMDLNYSERLFKRFATGITVKFLSSRLVETLNANAAAIDLGGQGRFMDDQLTIGLSALNIGSGLSYLDSTESLPITVRGGASYLYPFTDQGRGLFSLDFRKVKDENLKEDLGFEYLWSQMLAFRAGYRAGQDQGKLSFGLGFLVRTYQIDYAYTFEGALGSQHTISLSAKFGKAKEDVEKTFETQARRAAVKKEVSADPNHKVSVALLDVHSLSDNDKDARAATEWMRKPFEKSGNRVNLVSRRKMDEALQKNYLALSQCRDISCAIEIGKGAGADKVVQASLGNLGAIYILKVKMMDVRTSAVDYAESGEAYSLAELEETARSIALKLVELAR